MNPKAFDPYDETPDYDDQNVTCRVCGTEGLTWVCTGARWRLADDKGLHSCKNKTVFPTLED